MKYLILDTILCLRSIKIKKIVFLILFMTFTSTFAKEIAPNYFFRFGISTRIEYTRLYSFQDRNVSTNPLVTAPRSFFPEEGFVRSLSILEFMAGKTPNVYFYGQIRLTSGFPYNAQTSYFGQGQIGAGLLVGLGGRIFQNDIVGLYLNWGLVWDSPSYNSLAYFAYFDNEINFQIFRNLSSSASFQFSLYLGFSGTKFLNSKYSVASLRVGGGIGFLFGK